jgi:hypothetical protein
LQFLPQLPAIPQQLGFAAAAAALVYEQTREPVAALWAVDFLATQLRMVYWDDRSPRGEPLVGMFQACASLLYPAFKENVEALLPILWSGRYTHESARRS